jgi:hypothetical protein
MAGRIGVLLTTLALLLAPTATQPATANAGTYDVYSCIQPDGAVAPVDGWTPFSTNSNMVAEDDCTQGGILSAGMLGWVEVPDGAQAGWTFLPPPGTSIAQATLNWEYGNADNEDTRSATAVESLEAPYHGSIPFATCVRSHGCCCSTYQASFKPNTPTSVPVQDLQPERGGASVAGITVVMECAGASGDEYCDGASTRFAASSGVRTATLALEDDSPPLLTVIGGSLTTGTELEGTQTLAISGSDSGSGIYQAILEVDGKEAQSTMIDNNNGHCQNVGQTTDGRPAFLYVVPCKLEINDQYLSFNLAGIPDGPHKLSVRVTDAAGNSTTVLNREVVIGRGACNGTCGDQAKLAPDDPKLLEPLPQRYPRSAMAFSGSLLEPTGAPVGGARVELLEQASYTGAPTKLVASTTTNLVGQWAFAVPKGPSRVLTVAWRSHVLDAGYATQLALHESVIADIGLKAPRRVRVGRPFDFRGNLAGGYIPPERSTIQFEIFFLGRWRTIETLHTNARGAFAYRYSFSTGKGISYRFRASIHYSRAYPFLAATSQAVRLEVR